MVKNGALRLFRVAGVDVYLHWSWLVILYLLWTGFDQTFPHKQWVVALLGAYVFMVGFHETMQIVAGRLVKGHVSEITISFLSRSSNLEVPQRPWPIIATYGTGILAYAALLGVTGPLVWTSLRHGLGGKEANNFAFFCLFVNVLFFVWCAVPVYPQDGGRVLQAVLWLFMSRKRSLQIACVVGVPVSLGLIGLGLWQMSLWWTVMAVLMFIQCLQGFRQARVFDLLEKVPRRQDVTCPHCNQHPFSMTEVTCVCGAAIDPFDTRGLCPACGTSIAQIPCPVCRQRSPIAAWFGPTGLFQVENVAPAAPVGPAPVQVVGDGGKPPAGPAGGAA
jgi:hypothetical protein